MRTIKLPDLSAHIEDDTYLDAAIRRELINDENCVFEFAEGTNEYHIKRFTDVAQKVNFWMLTHKRSGSAMVTVAQPAPVAVTPAPAPVEAEPEVLPELAPIVEEPVEMSATSKKKKNG